MSDQRRRKNKNKVNKLPPSVTGAGLLELKCSGSSKWEIVLRSWPIKRRTERTGLANDHWSDSDANSRNTKTTRNPPKSSAANDSSKAPTRDIWCRTAVGNLEKGDVGVSPGTFHPEQSSGPVSGLPVPRGLGKDKSGNPTRTIPPYDPAEHPEGNLTSLL